MNTEQKDNQMPAQVGQGDNKALPSEPEIKMLSMGKELNQSASKKVIERPTRSGVAKLEESERTKSEGEVTTGTFHNVKQRRSLENKKGDDKSSEKTPDIQVSQLIEELESGGELTRKNSQPDLDEIHPLSPAIHQDNLTHDQLRNQDTHSGTLGNPVLGNQVDPSRGDEIQQQSSSAASNQQTCIEVLKRFSEKAWAGHNWLVGQPFNSDSKVLSVSIYTLYAGLAVTLVVLFWTNTTTYTDAVEKTVSDLHVRIPDLIVCPPSSCFDCQAPFSNYHFTHAVWWNYDLLAELNMTEMHVNLLARTVHSMARGNEVELPVGLKPYLEKATEIVKAGYNVTYVSNLASISQNFSDDAVMNITYLWYLLSKFPNAFLSNYEKLEYGRNSGFQANLVELKTTWVENAYCLIWLNKFGSTQYKGYDLLQMWAYVPNGTRYWMGNAGLEVIKLSLFHQMHPFLNVERVQFVAYFVQDFSLAAKLQTLCQPAMSLDFLRKCTVETVDEYWVYSRDMVTDSIQNGYQSAQINFLINKVIHISKFDAYSVVACVEISMSILGFIIGLSVWQIFTVVQEVVKRCQPSELVRRIVQGLMTLFVICGVVSQVSYDIISLSGSEVVNKLTVNPVVSLPVPSVLLKHPVGRSFLNMTKIMELNVSLGLLQYIHIASHMTLPEMVMLKKEGLILSDETKGRVLYSNSSFELLSKLDKEYDQLAKKLGIKNTEPANDLLENLSLDICQIVVRCFISGKALRNCCQRFEYQLLDVPLTELSDNRQLILRNKNNTLRFSAAMNDNFPDMMIEINQDAFSFSTYQQHLDYALTFGTLHWFYNMFEEIYGIKANNLAIRLFQYSFVGSSVPKIPLKKGGGIELSVRAIFQDHTAFSDSCSADMPITCYGFSGLLYGEVRRNLFVFKNCGCYVCYKGMNPTMKAKKQCCTPKQAVSCLAHPNNYHPVCTQLDRRERDKCSKESQMPFSETFKPDKWIHQFTLLTHPSVLKLGKPFPPNVTKEDMKEFGCINETLESRPCKRFIFHPLHTHPLAIKSKDGFTTIGIHIDRSDVVSSNFQQDRSDNERRYVTIEVFGLFLGGFSMFFGTDLVSLFESLLNLLGSKNTGGRIGRFLKAVNPVMIHWLRQFRHVVMPNVSNNSEAQATDRQADYDDQGNEHSEENGKKTNVQAALFSIVVIILFLTGVSICGLALFSGMLNMTEYNFAVSKELVDLKPPSIAACKQAQDGDMYRQKDIESALSDAGCKCWIHMAEVNCLDVFELYVFNGIYHCWIMSNSSKLDPAASQERTTDFNFIFGCQKRSIFHIWIGSLHHVSEGHFRPIEADRHLVHSYYRIDVFNVNKPQCSEVEEKIPCPQCKLPGMRMCCPFKAGQLDIPNIFEKKIGSQCAYSVYQVAKKSMDTLGASSVWRAYDRPFYEEDFVIKGQIPGGRDTPFNQHRYFAISRGSNVVISINEIPRLSVFAKFGVAVGYLDLFVGISLLSLAGTPILLACRYIRKRLCNQQ